MSYLGRLPAALTIKLRWPLWLSCNLLLESPPGGSHPIKLVIAVEVSALPKKHTWLEDVMR